jgi:hypothetical protein
MKAGALTWDKSFAKLITQLKRLEFFNQTRYEDKPFLMKRRLRREEQVGATNGNFLPHARRSW